MAAAAEGWRDSAGCRLCDKPARTEGEKQRLPNSIVECTLPLWNLSLTHGRRLALP